MIEHRKKIMRRYCPLIKGGCLESGCCWFLTELKVLDVSKEEPKLRSEGICAMYAAVLALSTICSNLTGFLVKELTKSGG